MRVIYIASFMALDKIVYVRAIYGKQGKSTKTCQCIHARYNVQYAITQAAFMHNSVARATQRHSLVHRHEQDTGRKYV